MVINTINYNLPLVRARRMRAEHGLPDRARARVCAARAARRCAKPGQDVILHFVILYYIILYYVMLYRIIEYCIMA